MVRLYQNYPKEPVRQLAFPSPGGLWLVEPTPRRGGDKGEGETIKGQNTHYFITPTLILRQGGGDYCVSGWTLTNTVCANVAYMLETGTF